VSKIICMFIVIHNRQKRADFDDVKRTVMFYYACGCSSLCGLVARVLGYRSGGPGSIPGTTRKKKCSGSGTGCTQPHEYKLRSYLIEK
jgi:hypothetical protein